MRITYRDGENGKMRNMTIRSKKTIKPACFYTGGGIWISAMYVSKNIYYAIDNDWYDDCFAIYDHNGEDDDTEFPCQNMIGFKEKSEFSDEDHKLFNMLKSELLKEMRK